MFECPVDGLFHRTLAAHDPDQIARNAIKEALERPLRLVIAAGGPHELQKHLLRHFLGDSRTSGHVQRKTVKRRLPPLVQLRERVLVAFLHQTVEFLVAWLHRGDHSPLIPAPGKFPRWPFLL